MLAVSVSPTATVAIAVGVVFAILFIIIVVFVVFIIIRRPRWPWLWPWATGSSQKEPNPDKRETLFPLKSSKPVPFDKFSQHVATLAKDSDLEYTNEYEVSLLCVSLRTASLQLRDDPPPRRFSFTCVCLFVCLFVC